MSEWLTRGTVWVALTFYVVAEVTRGRGLTQVARRFNLAGCLVFLAHVACAFHFYHHWSHGAAYADTARQTQELFRMNWGGGLWFNYVFAAMWLGDAVWEWIRPESHTTRPAWVRWGGRGFFWFMMFNGAVVFAKGMMKWYGLLLTVFLLMSWARGAARLTEAREGR